jgi:hypothetical protein
MISGSAPVLPLILRLRNLGPFQPQMSKGD